MKRTVILVFVILLFAGCSIFSNEQNEDSEKQEENEGKVENKTQDDMDEQKAEAELADASDDRDRR